MEVKYKDPMRTGGRQSVFSAATETPQGHVVPKFQLTAILQAPRVIFNKPLNLGAETMPRPSSTQIHTFLPLPPRGLTAPPPEYHQPVLISTYSHQPDRSIMHDDSSMAYHRQATLGVDLNHGFDRRTERDENLDEHLDGVCEALMEVEKRDGKGERRGGIITWRGMITRYVLATRRPPRHI